MPTLSYDHVWNGYRRRFRVFTGAWLGGFVFAATLMHALSRLGAANWLGMVIAACWLLGFAIAGIRLQLFACPRCRNPFSSGHFYCWPFARKCLYCGLPKWQ